MYKQKQPVAKGEVGQILLRLKMALKHFWFRRRLRARDRMRWRVEKYYAQSPNLWRESLARLYRRKVATLSALVLSIFGCGLLVFPTIAREPSGIPGGTLDMFNANDIPYWDPCAGGSSGGGGGESGGGGGANEVEGSDNQAKIWNWFVNAGIDGVSDSPMAIAGIMGNISVESAGTFDPFIRGGGGGTYYGLFMMGKYFPNFPPTIEKAAGGSYWWLWPGNPPNIPEDANDKAIAATLDYATTDAEPGVSSWANFMSNLGVITNKSPRSYAELFMVTFENCYNGNSTIEDPGVASIAKYATWQGGEARRNAADEIYEKFGQNGAKNIAKKADKLNIISSKDDDFSDKLVASNQKDDVVADVPGNSAGNKNSIAKAKNANKQDTDFPEANHWNDGNNAEMKRLLEAYGDLAYQTGRAYDLPWQAILVQMRYESKDATCGDANDNPVHRPNNFWGIGCPVGAGANAPAYDNLGEGFKAYGEKVHNGNHDQAIGISDSKEYLEKLGPTWVQGKKDGEGYHDIEGMKNSLDALQKYIDSDEGQKIVKGFTNYEGDYMNGDSLDDDCVMGSSSAQIDNEGWITGGIEGLVKESALNIPLSESPASHPKFTTSDGKAQTIILHHTAGGPCNGLACYGGNLYPPHFTINLKEKKGWQHFPMNRPSLATKYADDYGVQIEIISYGNSTINCIVGGTDPQWDTANFTDEEWDYLAQYMLAISHYTGVPLESNLDWSRANVVPNWQSFNGVMGHMHNQSDKCDPGNIWNQVKAAIDRAGGGEYCMVSDTDICGNITNTTTKPKSGSVSALQEYVLKYAWPKIADGAAHAKFDPMPDYKEALDRAPYKGAYELGDGYTDCGAFVQVLIHDSGWDPNFYGIGATDAMLTWLQNPANGWEKITPTDASQLQPGDVAVNSNHTWVFVGDIPGFESQFADASWGGRVPSATDTGLNYDGEIWFRKKGQ